MGRHKVFADLSVAVDPHVSVRESQDITDAVEVALKDHVRSFGNAVVHVSPATAIVE